MKIPSTSWWKTDNYHIDMPAPDALQDLAPYGLAVVSVNTNGSTQPGWGEGFIDRFVAKQFSLRPKAYAYKKSGRPFAFVMRAVKAICIDIDGKNGGLVGALQLGLLPPTLAETSKSGSGYHLFYEVDDEWDEEFGFAALNDVINIVPGVDIRATGCVYHYNTQRWNDRNIAPLPDFIADLLKAKHEKRQAEQHRFETIVNEGDEMDKAMEEASLLEELAKDVPDGKRNNTLFAIGSKLRALGVTEWPEIIDSRAQELGLDYTESDKLLKNIEKYA